MSVVYNNGATTLVKDKRMQLVADIVNTKTPVASSGTGSTGTLVIGTSALSGATGVLATFTLPNPCGTVASGVLTLAAVTSVTASATGTAALAEIRRNDGTVVVSGLSVGTSGTDITINAVAISSGQTVTLSSGTITHG